MAEHDGRAVPLRQAADLVEQCPELFCFARSIDRSLPPARDCELTPLPRRFVCARSGRDPGGNLVEPTTHALSRANLGGFADEDEKRCLEGVFGRVCIVGSPAADTEHQRPIPRKERLKSSLI